MSLSLQVFVSHSRSEAAWIDALRLREEILVGQNRWNFWVDATDIVSGDLWTERVKAAIKRADAVLLLVGRDFTNSEPVFKTELPAIRDRWEDGLPLVCVPIEGGNLDALRQALGVDELKKLVAARDWDKPLPGNPKKATASDIDEVRDEILRALKPQVTMLQRVLNPKYELQLRLGSGPLGAMYTAWDSQLDRKVAVKVLKNREHDTVFDESIRRVIPATNHPNILDVYGAWLERDPHHYVRQYIDGHSLKEMIDARESGLPAEFVQDAIIAIGGAIDYAHDHSVRSLNIKPSNIIVRDPFGHDEHFYLCPSSGDDLLIERQGGKKALGEDILYLPPELGRRQFRRPRPRHADQYRLGVVAYEMLLGRKAFAKQVKTRKARSPPSWQSLKDLDFQDCPKFLRDTVDRMMHDSTGMRFERLSGAVRDISGRDVELQIAKESYQRIIGDKAKQFEFFATFYRKFLACDGVSKHFPESKFPRPKGAVPKGGEWPKQFLSLKEAVLMLLAYAVLGEQEEPTILTRIAEHHDQRNIPPDLYRQFGRLLVETAVEQDTGYKGTSRSQLQHAWERAIRDGIDYMCQHSSLRR